MAISAANLTAGYSDTDATSYATASVSPASNRLILLTVETNTDTTTTPTAPTASGCGLTWVEVATLAYDTSGTTRGRITLLRAMGASPSSGAVTIDFAGQTQASCVWSIDEFDGVDTGGTHGSAAVVQSATASSSASFAPSVTLSSFADASNNAAFGAFSKEGNPSGFTAGSGFTELGNATATAARTRLSTEWRLGEDTTVDCTTPSNNQGGCIAVEIAAASGGPQTITPAGTITPTGTLTRRAGKTLAGSVAPAGTVARRAAKALAGTIAPAGTLAKTIAKFLTGTVAPAGALTLSTAQAGATDAIENALLDHLLGGPAYTPPPMLHLALYTTAPADSGSGGVEATGGDYTRVAVPNDPDHWPPADSGAKANAHSITWPTPSGSWGTIRAVGILDAAAGGTLLFHAQVTPVAVTTGQVVQLGPGTLALTLA